MTYVCPYKRIIINIDIIPLDKCVIIDILIYICSNYNMHIIYLERLDVDVHRRVLFLVSTPVVLFYALTRGAPRAARPGAAGAGPLVGCFFPPVQI